jgi:hypothetical protein
MKKTLLIGSLLILVLVAVAVAAPDFSGTWVLDRAKSDVSQGGGKPSQVQDVTMIIKQGNNLVIETTMDIDSGPATTKAVYSLSDDGKVLTVTNPRSENTYKQVFNKK